MIGWIIVAVLVCAACLLVIYLKRDVIRAMWNDPDYDKKNPIKLVEDASITAWVNKDTKKKKAKK